LANWRFDFQYELQIGSGWSGSNILTLVTPSGGVLAFQRQSDGSLISYPDPAYKQPQTDFTLTLVGSWPTDLTTLNSASTTWTLVDGDDTTWTLQTFADPITGLFSIARPVSMLRRDGLQLNFNYVAPLQLTSISDAYGNQITFDWLVDDYSSGGGYTVARAISKAHLPSGYSIVYSYDTVGSFPASGPQPDRLSKVQYLDSTGAVIDQVTYQYNNSSFPYAITGIFDANGVQRWSVGYDSQGRATSSSGPGGTEAYAVSFGAMASPGGTFTRTVTNPLGRQDVYTYTLTGSNQLQLTSVNGQASANAPASARSYTTDTNGFVASLTDENGNLTTYTRDPRGMPAQVVEASGTASARTTTKTWDATRRIPTTVAAPGLTTTYVYDNPSGGSGGGGPGSGARRFWRLQISNSNGAGFGGNYYANMAEVQMFETAGGPDLARNASTILSSQVNSSYPASQSVDGDWTTTSSLITTSAPPYPNMYWEIDFGAGANKSINAVSITAWTTATGTPSDFVVEWSSDGLNWTQAWAVSGQANWGAGETRLFVNPSYAYSGSFWGSHTYWRALMGQHVGGNWSAAELQFRAAPGGSDELAGAIVSASTQISGTYAPSKAHDGNASTFWVSNTGAQGQWIQYQFSSAVPLAEVYWTARNDGYSEEAPTSGTMEYSDDGSTWHFGFKLRNTSGFTNGSSNTNTDPAYH
jgi:hypothetical protein